MHRRKWGDSQMWERMKEKKETLILMGNEVGRGSFIN